LASDVVESGCGRASRGAGWAEDGVGYAAPAAGVFVGEGDAVAEVPACVLGNVGCREFGWVEGDGTVIVPEVEVDAVSALMAPGALSGAQ
jgi:hypothetical protein